MWWASCEEQTRIASCGFISCVPLQALPRDPHHTERCRPAGSILRNSEKASVTLRGSWDQGKSAWRRPNPSFELLEKILLTVSDLKSQSECVLVFLIRFTFAPGFGFPPPHFVFLSKLRLVKMAWQSFSLIPCPLWTPRGPVGRWYTISLYLCTQIKVRWVWSDLCSDSIIC